jgi:two-component system, LytTR family, response regulator
MLRTLIVDDEAPARARLRRMLAPYAEDGRVELVGEACDGVEAVEALEQEPVDLLLLDIQMPGLNGFDVLDRLAPESRPIVVFVTAYDAYALKAFDSAAVDYLLKPVAEERLAETIARAERFAGQGDHQDRLADLLEYLDRQPALRRSSGAGEYLKHLSIPGSDRITVVAADRLLAAEVEDGLTRLFVLPDGDGPVRLARHTVTQPLDALERRLDPEAFMRVHRSAIVQVTHIREMVPWFSGRYKLILTGGHEVVASRARSKELRERLSV